jgi:GH18 family chitinase
MVCYFASWTAASGYFKASQLKACVCTHVMYAFIGAYPNATIEYNNDVDIVKGK